MKYYANLLVIMLLSASFLGFYYAPQQQHEVRSFTDIPASADIPENVKSVLDRSCLPCHGADGKWKAKMKWDFEKMDEYDNAKMISRLVKISEVVEEDKMPPKKFVKKHPEDQLTDEEKKLVMEWADGTAESLTGGGE